jgi:hypothetical protein
VRGDQRMRSSLTSRHDWRVQVGLPVDSKTAIPSVQNNRIFPGASSSSFLLLHSFDTAGNRKPTAARGEQWRVLFLCCARGGSTLIHLLKTLKCHFSVIQRAELNPLQKWYQVAF